MTKLDIALGHEVPREEWAEVVRKAGIYRRSFARREGLARARRTLLGPRPGVGPIVDLRGRSNKHSGVSGIPTQLLTLHSAECPLQGGYARSLTDWAINTNVVASWHRFVDPIQRVLMIDDNYAAWHASEANPMSIGWEQAGYARFTRAEWLTTLGLLQIESLAYDMAGVAERDNIPLRWLPTNEVTAVTTYGNRSIRGFCTHRQIDPETRTDPGNGYPFDVLTERLDYYMNGSNQPIPVPTKEWDEMATREEVKAAAKEGFLEVLNDPGAVDKFIVTFLHRPITLIDPTTGVPNGTTTIAKKVNWQAYNFAALGRAIAANDGKLDKVATLLAELLEEYRVDNPDDAPPVVDDADFEPTGPEPADEEEEAPEEPSPTA